MLPMLELRANKFQLKISMWQSIILSNGFMNNFEIQALKPLQRCTNASGLLKGCLIMMYSLLLSPGVFKEVGIVIVGFSIVW